MDKRMNSAQQKRGECEHGSLKRQCEVCRLQDELGTLAQKLQVEFEENIRLRAELSDRDAWAKAILEEKCSTDEVHCGCVPVLRKEIKDLRSKLAVAVEAMEEAIRDGGTLQCEYAGCMAENTLRDALAKIKEESK